MGLRWRPWDQRPEDTLGMGLMLLAVGVALGLVLPAVIGALGMAARKEVESLRPAWLTSVFGVQATLALTPRDAGLEVMLFAATCALLAALAFGVEFQQRTLAGLLSQPMARDAWWRIKTRTLAVALLLNGFLFLLSSVSSGRDLTPELVFGTLVAAAVAWGTTPCWTLWTRGLLSGLVFSLAVPLLGLTVVAAAVDAWGAADILRLDRPRTDATWFYGLLFVVAPAYAVIGARLGHRRWMRLEAPDQALAETGMLGLPRLRLGMGREVGRRWGWGLLVGKELRLHSMTLILVAVTVVMGLLVVAGTGGGWENPYLSASFVLLAAGTVVVAGATTVAEERRLGTLDNQVLAPAGRGWQWGVKIGVAGFLAIGVLGVVVVVFSGRDAGRSWEGEEAMRLGVVALALFVPAVLASSGAANAVRAMIAGLALSAGVGLTLAGLGTPFWLRWAVPRMEALQEEFSAHPERFIAEASALSEAEVGEMASRVASSDGPWASPMRGDFWLWLPVLAVLPAMGWAWKNFSRPADAGRRWPGQAGGFLAVLACLTAAGSWMVVSRAEARRRAEVFLEARGLADLEQTLSDAERRLWTAYRPTPATPSVFIVLVPVPGARSVTSMNFPVPLRPGDRRLIIERGRIRVELREALVREALARGETATNTPVDPAVPGVVPRVTGVTPFAIDPDLLQRYGLILQTNAADTVEPSASAESTSSAVPQFQMSPELMRRYGLLPPPSPAGEPIPSTNPPPSPIPGADETP